ncbi:MAG: TetR family transcriptional regulator, partial [Bacilli bacterium]
HLNIYFKNRDQSSKFLQPYNNDPEMMEVLHNFFTNYHIFITELMENKGIREASEHAKAFWGMLDSYQRDIFFNKTFTYSSLLKAASFTVKLFLKGCL